MRNFSTRLCASVLCWMLTIAWIGGIGTARAAGVQQDNLREGHETFEKAFYCPEATKVSQMLSDSLPLDKEFFADYFDGILYPHFTQFANRERLAKIGRDVLRKFFYPTAKNQAAFDLFNEVTLAKMKQYATGSYQIETRCYALLFIGVTQNPSLRGVKPVQLHEALNFLVEAAGDEKLPDAVRFASFVGIRRHVAPGQPEEVKKLVADAMSAIVKGRAAKDNEEDVLGIEAALVASSLGKDTPEVRALLHFLDKAVDSQPRELILTR